MSRLFLPIAIEFENEMAVNDTSRGGTQIVMMTGLIMISDYLNNQISEYLNNHINPRSNLLRQLRVIYSDGNLSAIQGRWLS
jgi:hypothetical protein